MSQLPNTANVGSLWITPTLKSGRVGEITAASFNVISDGPLFS